MENFWVVLNKTGSDCWRGLLQYATEEAAIKAAGERVEKYPHIEYVVCKAVAYVHAPRPKVEVEWIGEEI